jgi:hypothetical protein
LKENDLEEDKRVIILKWWKIKRFEE